MSVSILNDVMGPVMRGPSSSHTAGGYRIALLLSALFGEPPDRVEVAFDPNGSYAPTFRILGVDSAFAAGLMAWDLTDQRYPDALVEVARSGVDLRFLIERLEKTDHPNTARVTFHAGSGAVMTAWARSIGGGLVEVTHVDDVPTLIDGKSWSTVLTATAAASGSLPPALIGALGEPEEPDRRGRHVVRCFRSSVPVDPQALETLRSIPGVARVRSAPAVFAPVIGARLFTDAAGMVREADGHGTGLGRMGLLYEQTLLGRCADAVTEEMTRRYEVMRRSVQEGLRDETVNMPLTEPTASRVMAAESAGRLALGGPSSRAAIRAMACMHTCNSRGVVCAAPTGGSAGVIPGALMTFAEERHLSDEEITTGLFAAGAIGLIIAERATFAAETAGCQVEIGAAGAMAAAAICDLAGGSPQQCADAAAIALQNTMGSVCDPVQGGCEIPCHTRNAAAAANAFLCADMILGGYRNPIPLDETIDASYAVGRMLPVQLRCTAMGGIAMAPSAQRMPMRDRGARLPEG